MIPTMSNSNGHATHHASPADDRHITLSIHRVGTYIVLSIALGVLLGRCALPSVHVQHGQVLVSAEACDPPCTGTQACHQGRCVDVATGALACKPGSITEIILRLSGPPAADH